MTNLLSYSNFASLVNGTGAALRVKQILQPAGGEGDKVFPPTYAASADKDSKEKAALKYATEQRIRVERSGDGQGESKEIKVPCVLLDSVASQANRAEEALLQAWEDKEINFPVISSDFGDDPDLSSIGKITTLEAPHRLADAIFRDSIDSAGILFRDTPEGKAFTAATPRNATSVFMLNPTALLFGIWDSTGPRGGEGSKFPRALVSEIVGINAEPGKKVGSRLDPLAINSKVAVFHDRNNPTTWTIDPAQAELDEKGQPKRFSRKGKADKQKGTASSINHGNQPPDIDVTAGGVTISYAEQVTVISLPALRRLRFPVNGSGAPLSGEERKRGEEAVRTSLAALGLVAIFAQRQQGYDLRSRCFLIPEGPLTLQVVKNDGEEENLSITWEQAKQLLKEATDEAARAGFPWMREPIQLRPAPKLLKLVKASQEAAAREGGSEEEAQDGPSA